MAFVLDPLPYAFDALEPYIDAKTMEIHHDKHHGTYVAKLNAALEQAPELQGWTIEELLRRLDAVPEKIRQAVRNHGGGHHNHSLFWKILTPGGSKEPSGEVGRLIERDFGSFTSFKEQFSQGAANLFGSGWQWLVLTPERGLKLVSLPNQDSPLSLGLTPILGLDVWEHAYYLKYQNRRTEYIDAFWHVVNWEKVGELLEKAG
ncbi:MAG: superoxide dismutase [Treponemataceae bacterium]|uniref:superoxide dismutase n=1 Tax=Treponema sp. J25 TaxID=2094121 RepID=UPI00104B2EEA|nr:superoxide dismutase [Treponema sp. J25]MCX7949920.1 superoxide dismutase [Treponemataceae bacterium]HOK00247.1 superoxide dismutase [Termitinemataceae bacterium]TCW61893.1 superoxide dismutase [Treponema sp. J25]HOM24296.1 superoxide dismutase [Termitinemataceae bacterium]HPQ01417.1 superoxide dismutase [Termitinemataceae bacterium]